MTFKQKKLEEFDELIDEYYIHRLAMHEMRSYLHPVVDKSKIKSFLSQSIDEAVKETKKEIKDKIEQFEIDPIQDGIIIEKLADEFGVPVSVCANRMIDMEKEKLINSI